MAAIDYGVAHIFGLRGTVGYMTVQSDSITDQLALDVEVANEDGLVITDHLDDRRIEITIEGVLKSEDWPDAGDQFSYGGLQYIIKNVEDKGSNKDFRKCSIKGVKYELIA